MHRAIFVALALAIVGLSSAPTIAEDREAIQLPAQAKQQFLSQMRQDIEHLDEILAALAADEFQEAADIAEINLTVGHKLWRRMADDGASMTEIRAERQRRAAAGMLGKGLHGVGRFLPEHFRAMGHVMHDAADAFAARARTVAEPASRQDYAEVFDHLQAITSACRGCHATFYVR